MSVDDRGTQFDILDKALAARGYELLARPTIWRQDYDEWMSSYTQLANYARSNSDNSYVARQWRDEEPRYANAPSLLLSKVRTANPLNYDTSISVSGQSGCDCGCGSNIPTLGYTPLDIRPGNYGNLPSRGGDINLFGDSGPSLGDGLRNMFSPQALPFFNNPDKLFDKKEVSNGIIVALIVGAILWGIHWLTKKKQSVS